MSKARELAELGAVYDSGALSNRNLIINGGMQVWQRATGATASANNYTTVDRYQMYEATDGAYTTQQSTGNAADTGHDLALQANVTTADGTIAAGQYAAILHRIEAQNLQHLRWGTAAGKNLVLSFWVKSNKTGIYSLSTEKSDSTTYRRVNEFTINAANTWEQKTIKIPPLTNSNSGGTIANDNGLGLKFEWCLAYGSTFTTTSLDQWITTAHFASTNQVNWMDSTSNNFYLTGVQLEVGTEATPFEHRSFGDELARCQRYYYSLTDGTSSYLTQGYQYTNSGSWSMQTPMPVTMRSAPSLVGNWTTSGYFILYSNNAGTITTNLSLNGSNTGVSTVSSPTTDAGDAGIGGGLYAASSLAQLAFNAEL